MRHLVPEPVRRTSAICRYAREEFRMRKRCSERGGVRTRDPKFHQPSALPLSYAPADLVGVEPTFTGSSSRRLHLRRDPDLLPRIVSRDGIEPPPPGHLMYRCSTTELSRRSPRMPDIVDVVLPQGPSRAMCRCSMMRSPAVTVSAHYFALLDLRLYDRPAVRVSDEPRDVCLLVAQMIELKNHWVWLAAIRTWIKHQVMQKELPIRGNEPSGSVSDAL